MSLAAYSALPRRFVGAAACPYKPDRLPLADQAERIDHLLVGGADWTGQRLRVNPPNEAACISAVRVDAPLPLC